MQLLSAHAHILQVRVGIKKLMPLCQTAHTKWRSHAKRLTYTSLSTTSTHDTLTPQTHLHAQ